MAIFTKTFVRCDACDQELELPRKSGREPWVSLQTEVRRLDPDKPSGDPLVSRTADLCPTCYAALQDSEFSNLFEQRPERSEDSKSTTTAPQAGIKGASA